MSDLKAIIGKVATGASLSRDEAADAFGTMMSGDATPSQIGGLLMALRVRCETVDEITGAVSAMRGRMLRVNAPADAVDIVGTGGDGSGSLNLSTGAALLAAACGLPVVKHGNRAFSSRSGSADLMEALGFTLPMDEIRAAQCFRATGFTFLFAPYFHPAMGALAPIRAALGIRTVFNLLGPLTNPAGPRYRLIGAYDAATAELMAGSLAGMDIARAWVVHGAAGWDEATPIGPFLAFDVTPDAICRREIDPCEFGLAACGPSELAGGDAAANLAALLDVFAGRDRGAHYAALALQCGLALFIAGRADSIQAGVDTARAAVDSGRAQEWLGALRRFAASSTARGPA